MFVSVLRWDAGVDQRARAKEGVQGGMSGRGGSGSEGGSGRSGRLELLHEKESEQTSATNIRANFVHKSTCV
jgi:hypothetical protein